MGARWLALVVVLVPGSALLVTSRSASATSYHVVTLGELATRAEVIVDARVEQRWEALDARGRTLNYARLLVLDAEKGARAGTGLTLVGLAPGSDDAFDDGVAPPVVGERAVFFLVRFRDVYLAAGPGLGRLEIEAGDGVPMVAPPPASRVRTAAGSAVRSHSVAELFRLLSDERALWAPQGGR